MSIASDYVERRREFDKKKRDIDNELNKSFPHAPEILINKCLRVTVTQMGAIALSRSIADKFVITKDEALILADEIKKVYEDNP